MFDLITGEAKHLPRHPALPIVISTTAQAVLLTIVVAVPMLFMADRLPDVPTMMAFVAAPPAPPPPPPPPAPPAVRKPPTPTRPVPPVSPFAAPIAAPERIEPEIGDEEGFDEGVPGGVEGGVPGGLVGGVVGGLPDPLPPPPPPPATRAPVRIGGQLEAPALLHRVEPIYPDIAVNARVQGIVILEAIVDEGGKVADVKVLRSANPLLEKAAMNALRQWRYEPLRLNGIPARFMLTVVLSFHLEQPKE